MFNVVYKSLWNSAPIPALQWTLLLQPMPFHGLVHLPGSRSISLHFLSAGLLLPPSSKSFTQTLLASREPHWTRFDLGSLHPTLHPSHNRVRGFFLLSPIITISKDRPCLYYISRISQISWHIART